MDPAKIAALYTGSTPGRRTNYTTPWGTTEIGGRASDNQAVG